MSTDSVPDGYAPGRCNIGQPGRTRRAIQGAASLAVAAGYAVFVLLASLPTPFLVGIFVPLTLGYEQLLEATQGLCVRLAMAGRYDFGAGSGASGAVPNDQAHQDDRVAAAKLTATAVVLGVVSTLLVWRLVTLFLPLG